MRKIEEAVAEPISTIENVSSFTSDQTENQSNKTESKH